MKAGKAVLGDWIIEALDRRGGKADLIDVCRDVWQHHEDDLWDAGDLFFTWQYDIRWSATDLRQRGVLKLVSESPRGVWELAT
jgi:hypothetical protein